jgi:hypothetical protein
MNHRTSLNTSPTYHTNAPFPTVVGCTDIDSHATTCFAADPGSRFLATSFLGLTLDICVMQPGRVVVVAIIMVTIHAYAYNANLKVMRVQHTPQAEIFTQMPVPIGDPGKPSRQLWQSARLYGHYLIAYDPLEHSWSTLNVGCPTGRTILKLSDSHLLDSLCATFQPVAWRCEWRWWSLNHPVFICRLSYRIIFRL